MLPLGPRDRKLQSYKATKLQSYKVTSCKVSWLQSARVRLPPLGRVALWRRVRADEGRSPALIRRAVQLRRRRRWSGTQAPAADGLLAHQWAPKIQQGVTIFTLSIQRARKSGKVPPNPLIPL